jgi:hypothetical protein
MIYFISNAITAAQMNAPQHGTLMAFPAILTMAPGPWFSKQILGEPLRLE